MPLLQALKIFWSKIQIVRVNLKLTGTNGIDLKMPIMQLQNVWYSSSIVWQLPKLPFSLRSRDLTVFDTGVSSVLPLGKHRLHIWHWLMNANCAFCASPRVIPGIIGIVWQLPNMQFSLKIQDIIKDRCVIGITLGEAQIAHLALFDECQLCALCFPKGNTDDTPVLNNVLCPEWKWHIWKVKYNAKYDWYYPWGRTERTIGIHQPMPYVQSVRPQR